MKRSSISPASIPRILVTAFGPFEGRTQNASHLALQQLKQTMPSIWTRVLPVDSVFAPSRLRQAIRKIQPDLLILLGEAAGSSTIRLEASAWNLLDFRIPDNAGREPRGTPIEPGGPEELKSTLPLEKIHAALSKANHHITLSTDPGRYLCNQIYYISRRMMERAIFIHLPLATNLPTSKAVASISEIIIRLTESHESKR